MQSRADEGPVHGPTEGNVLNRARSIAIAAALVTCACALVAIPVAAFGDDSSQAADLALVPSDVLEAREDVAEANETALEDAPLAVGATCTRTLEVDGIGDACRTKDDLVRVELSDGSSATIHGLDAPPATADAFAPTSQAQVDGAGPEDIVCAPEGTRRYALIYARPSDTTSRYGSIAPKLQTEAYKMSAFLDAESQSVDPRKGKRLPMRCDGSTPTVLHATLDPTGGAGVSFTDVWEGLRDLGYSYNNASSTERYIVYYDGPSEVGAAGTGHIFNDARPGQENNNNKGGFYALEYRWAGGNDVPHWDVLMHEVMHTMGGIPNSAPNTSGSGHCNDGLDVMCYADGGPASSYTSGQCPQKLLDCGRDDYFNPSPAAGNWLAANWNVAGTNNLWLEHRATGDGIAPTAPTSIAQTGASNAAVGISWAPATDDTGVTGYVVRRRTIGGAWVDVTTTNRLTASVPGLAPTTAYEVEISARDAAGNVGPAATAQVATNDTPDTVAPAAPIGLRVAKATLTTATFTWRDTNDNVGVAGYELRLVTTPKLLRKPRSMGSTPATTVTVPLRGLIPGSRQRFELVARDDARNTSKGRYIYLTVPKDRAKPTAPAAATLLEVGRTHARLRWNASKDNAGGTGVKHYVVYVKRGGKWKPMGTIGATKTLLHISGLQRRTTYYLRVHARDGAKNLSGPSRLLVVRTR